MAWLPGRRQHPACGVPGRMPACAVQRCLPRGAGPACHRCPRSPTPLPAAALPRALPQELLPYAQQLARTVKDPAVKQQLEASAPPGVATAMETVGTGAAELSIAGKRGCVAGGTGGARHKEGRARTLLARLLAPP